MSKIEWTDETWNPVRGCSKVSPGCENCYAMRQAHRQNTEVRSQRSEVGKKGAYDGLTRMTAHGPQWTGVVRTVPESLERPLHWRKPRKIFVNSMSDLFHESLSTGDIAEVFAVMMAAHWHVFQVLTKRHGEMGALLGGIPLGPPFENGEEYARKVAAAIHEEFIDKLREALVRRKVDVWKWPLPNVWLGVSVENQKYADERIPVLLETPAAVRFVSCEPLLGEVDLEKVPTVETVGKDSYAGFADLDWVIVGGESGPGARPMHPDWARRLREQCQAAGMPFFFKQWGAWTPEYPGYDVEVESMEGTKNPCGGYYCDESVGHIDCKTHMYKVGKMRAGAKLDGRMWREFPSEPTVSTVGK